MKRTKKDRMCNRTGREAPYEWDAADYPVWDGDPPFFRFIGHVMVQRANCLSPTNGVRRWAWPTKQQFLLQLPVFRTDGKKKKRGSR